MHILAIYQHYWPDTAPYGTMLRCILGRLAADGHDVTVVTAQPNYAGTGDVRAAPPTELLDGVAVRRIALPWRARRGTLARLTKILVFQARACALVLAAPKPDVVWVNTTPPVVQGLMGQLLARLRGGALLYHCQDIHPELLVHAGYLRNRFLIHALRRLDQYTCRRADTVVTLSCDMARTLAKRSDRRGPPGNLSVINNFWLQGFMPDADVPADLREKSDRFRFLFAGNLGHFQNLELVVDAFARLAKRRHDVELVFVGSGAAERKLQARAGALLGDRIRFLGRHSPEATLAAMDRADMGIVSLAPGIYRCAYPSKTSSYLSRGLPVLVVVEEESALAEEIRAQRVGAIPDALDAAGLSATMDASAAGALALKSRSEIKSYATSHFAPERVLEHWSDLVHNFDRATAR